MLTTMEIRVGVSILLACGLGMWEAHSYKYHSSFH
jgi:hypothetical protein